MADAALKATGYPEPKDLDRSEYLITCFLNPRRPFPGEAQFIDAAPIAEVQQIRRAWANTHNGAEPDQHTVARLLLKARLVTPQ